MSKYAPCMICSGEITSGRSDRKVCSRECHDERARRRAGEWYRDNGDRPEARATRAAASRRSYLKAVADPELLAARRQAIAEWRARNPEAMRAQHQAWRDANPEAARAKVQRRRALLLGAFVAEVDINDLWERDGGLCGICGEPIDRLLRWPHKRCLTLDHVLALADGGLHEPANAQLAHHDCNARKGARIQRP